MGAGRNSWPSAIASLSLRPDFVTSCGAKRSLLLLLCSPFPPIASSINTNQRAAATSSSYLQLLRENSRSISDMESSCIHSGCYRRRHGEETKKSPVHRLCNQELRNKSSSVRSRPTTLPVIVIAICLLSRGNALSFPPPLSCKRLNSISCTPLYRYIYPPRRAKYQSQQSQQDTGRRRQTNSVSAATPFNHDIARILFAPLFFSLYHYKNKDLNYPSSSPRHHFTRPSPFEDPSCALLAERMLRRMMENRHRSEGRTICPDSRTFGLVASAYGRLRWGQRSDGRKSDRRTYTHNMIMLEEEVSPADKLQGLLQMQLRLCHREGWRTEIRPTVDMFNRMLKRLARQSGMLRYQGSNSSAEQALLWLQLMRSPMPQYHGSDKESKMLCPPNAMTYAHVIDALSVRRDPAPVGVEQLKNKSLAGKSGLSVFESIHIFAHQIDVQMIESETRQSALMSETFLIEAEALLTLLEYEYNKYSDKSPWKDKVERALAHAYTCLAEAWGRNSVIVSTDGGKFTNQVFTREHCIERSHALLSRLEALARESIPPSCYLSVILALSTSNSSTAATLAEDILGRMIAQYAGGTPSRFIANEIAKAFSGCIAAHARNNDAPKAENILNQMIDLYYDGGLGPEFVPEIHAFGTCIALRGKYNHDRSRDSLNSRRKRELPTYHQRLHNADRAEDILSQLEFIEDNELIKGNEKFVVGATPYNIAILARVKTIDGKPDRNNPKQQEGNERVILHAQCILDHMEYERRVMPDPYTYSILLHAWCQQSRPGNEKAADYAEELLRRRIEDIDISKIMADFDMPDKKRKKNVVGEVWPNVKHYSSVLKAHAKTKSPGGAKKALALLCEMERRHYDADLVEDAEGSGSTEFHVDQKNVAKPDLVCYSIVIDAFANSRLPEASAVALRLLRAVETKYDAGDESMKLNTRIYTAVILSLVHSPFRADEDHDDSGISAAKRINNNAQRAWSILEKMKMNQVYPNSFTYNYIINAAAESTEDSRSSFEVAVRAFQELRTTKASMNPDTNNDVLDPCHPDSFTFSFMIKACNKLLPNGPLRSKVISQVFRECCRSGYLNDAILDRVWRGLSSEAFHLLVEKNTSGGKGNKEVPLKSPIKVDALPSSWSRCCTQHQEFPRHGSKA